MTKWEELPMGRCSLLAGLRSSSQSLDQIALLFRESSLKVCQKTPCESNELSPCYCMTPTLTDCALNYCDSVTLNPTIHSILWCNSARFVQDSYGVRSPQA